MCQSHSQLIASEILEMDGEWERIGVMGPIKVCLGSIL